MICVVPALHILHFFSIFQFKFLGKEGLNLGILGKEGLKVPAVQISHIFGYIYQRSVREFQMQYL